MNKFLIILGAVFLLYLLVCLGVYVFQQKFIFYPQKGSQPPPDDLNITEHFITNADGQQLHAWWMPVDTGALTVLFFHGNAGNVSRGEKRMRLLREMGFNALAIDYRGYGISTGEIKKEEDVYEDARAAYEYLQKTLAIPEDKIIIWGWSLGGAVAVNLAQNKKCHALVMEATFNSMLEMANRIFWYIPNRLTLKFNFASGEKLSHVTCPILFIHSRADKTVPFSQGEKLFANCKGEKKFIEITGDHNHGLFDSKESFMPQALPFLK
jgi:pimeloyl-ACP methyl ester carboxylesterase